MKRKPCRAVSALRERDLVRKFRSRLWPLEIQLPQGWLWYRQLCDAEKKVGIRPGKSELPILKKPRFMGARNGDLFEVNQLTGKLVGIAQPSNPNLAKVEKAVSEERRRINGEMREFRSKQTLVRLLQSGLTRDDYSHLTSRIGLMLEEVKSGDLPPLTPGISLDKLFLALTTPTEYEVFEPECSLFSDRGGNYVSVDQSCTDDAHFIRDWLFSLAFANARRTASMMKDGYSPAATAWLHVAHALGGESKRSRPAYSEEEGRRIVRLFEEAMSLQWSELFVSVLRKGKFSDPVTDYAQSVIRAFDRDRKIVMRDGFTLSCKDSTNEELWDGIYLLVCKSDKLGYVELPKDWKRRNRRTGTKRSKGAKRVAKFLKYVQSKMVGRGGDGMYRLVGEPI